MTINNKDLIVAPSDFALTAREIELVRSQTQVLEGRISAITDDYYDHLMGTQYASLLAPERAAVLKSARVAHWRMLITADFVGLQSDYMNNFGPRLLESGFPRAIFVLAADWFAVEFSRLVERCGDIPKTLKAELRTALTKLAFFDLALANAAVEVAYLD